MNWTNDFDPAKYQKDMEARAHMENKYEWRKWTKDIPAIPVKPDWMMKVIPPFGGAVARFQVQIADAWVSVYLDCYDELGIVGQPYWEVYPVNGDTARVLMNDVDELVDIIDEALNKQLLGKENEDA